MNKSPRDADFTSAEEEIIYLLQKMQMPADPDRAASPPEPDADMTDRADEQTSDLVLSFADPESAPEPDAPKPDAADDPALLFIPESEPSEPPEPPAPPEPRASHRREGAPAHAENIDPWPRIGRMLCALFPKKGDPASEIVRKSVFILSLAVFICSLGFLLYRMVLEPRSTDNRNTHYAELYRDVTGNEENKTGYDYPLGMLPSFRQLYDINPDIAGWLTYRSTDDDSFLQIDQPVVHCADNETYLSRAFDGSKSRSGTLFFDADNAVGKEAVNRVSIIYGHNMASGLMFARLNRLISNVHYARSAPVITLDTLYESRQYLVFAVAVLDEGAESERHFSYLRTRFSDDADFLNYVQELRARSLYDYPVEVGAGDELLLLSTCTNRSQAKVSNGRLAVVARRVRYQEEPQMDVSRIVNNDDVIMPYAWYTAQKLTPHVFYSDPNYHVPGDSAVTTAPVAGTSTPTAFSSSAPAASAAGTTAAGTTVSGTTPAGATAAGTTDITAASTADAATSAAPSGADATARTTAASAPTQEDAA